MSTRRRWVDRSDRVCVVGAGAAGLAAAKNLMACGFEVDVLEREDDLGGIWNYGKPNARVYRSTYMISSKPFTQYPDFPMPEEYPDYPHHTQVLAYLRAYAAHFGVDRRIEYRTPVERLAPVEEGREGWEVTLGSGAVRRYGAVVIANGHLWCPRLPEYPGEFHGRILHSAEYRTPEIFAGKRVLVVGGGNSGCDIVVEAAQNAEAAFHSTRRGYHYVPKYAFGIPADQVGDLMLRLRLPLAVRRTLAQLNMRMIVGSPRRIGLPAPDHKLFETHPIVNSLLPYYVQHGAIAPKPDIARLEGDGVRFVDGSREQVEVIVFATGYRIVFPFIDHALLNWQEGRPRLYQHIFHPTFDNLFVAGMIQTDSGVFSLMHWQTQAIALFLRAVETRSPAADWLRARKALPQVGAGQVIRYKDSTRHYLEVEHWSYLQALKRIVRRLSEAAAEAPPPAESVPSAPPTPAISHPRRRVLAGLTPLELIRRAAGG